MKTFLQYTAAICTALLSWWQLQLHANLGPAGGLLVLLGGVSAYLTLRGYRIAYWLGAILGLSYGAEVALRLRGDSFHAASPLIGWALALMACSATLLHLSREKKVRRAKYERPW